MKLGSNDKVFYLQCGFYERFTPMRNGMVYHAKRNCNRKKCHACESGLDNMFLTSDPFIANKLRQYADPQTLERLDRHISSLQYKLKLSNALRPVADIYVPAPDGLQYFPFQLAGIEYMSQGNTLNADEMGIGKTIQALGVINLKPAIKNVLLICPARLKINWYREASKWLIRSFNFHIVKGRKRIPDNANFVIINYEVLHNHLDDLQREWDALIVDECQAIRKTGSRRSKCVYGGKFKTKVKGEEVEIGAHPINAKHKMFLTGTPLENGEPKDCLYMFRYLQPEYPEWKWVSKFMQKYYEPPRRPDDNSTEHNTAYVYFQPYKVPRFVGLLQTHARSTAMVARMSDDVLPQLPERRKQIVVLDGALAKAQLELEIVLAGEVEEKRREMKQLKDSGDEQSFREDVRRINEEIMNKKAMISEIRKELGKSKLPYVIEHLRESLQDGRKFVCFVYHRFMAEEIHDAFGNQSRLYIGGMSEGRKQAAVDDFQQNPDVRLFTATLDAGNSGITLTASSRILFAEQNWMPGIMAQAGKRIHRIGQRFTCLEQYIMFDESYDFVMAKKIIDKQETIDSMMLVENMEI